MENKLLVPNATAFVASFCIMVIEIVAGRIVARYLGTSLYTWTSVIGVVLAGIAVGSYVGGRLADKFNPKKLLSVLFIIASVSCVTVPVLNKLVGNRYLLLMLPWVARIAAHVTIIFLLPSVMLGMIGPVVAKFALDQGAKPGQTVGNVYAWGAAGSIAGTFITGFLLVSFMGTVAIIFTVSGVLAVLGVLYARKARFTYLWLFLLILLTSSTSTAAGFVKSLGFRETIDPTVVYDGQSRYSHLTVLEPEDPSHTRELVLDGILHNTVDMEDPANIYSMPQYPYLRLYGAVTELVAGGKKDIRAMVLGGGAYVFPQYIKKNWPESSIDVVEIDPAVTETAARTLGFSAESGIDIYHMDARNHVDDALRKKRQKKDVRPFDIIYGDAISGLSVPYQLTTLEFNEKIKGLLAPEGVYIVNVVDYYSSGRFLGALINTLGRTFSHVYVYSTGKRIEVPSAKKTFVVICSREPMDLQNMDIPAFDGVMLSEENLTYLEAQSRGIILTDDYAPVDSLLAPVAHERGVHLASMKLKKAGDEMAKQDRLKEAIRYYSDAIEINPYNSAAYNNLGNVLAREGRPDEAINNFMKATELSPRFVLAYHNLAITLAQEGRLKEAERYLKEALKMRPDFAEVYYGLGTLYSIVGAPDAAAGQYKEALKYDAGLSEAHYALGNIAFTRGNLEEALGHYEDAIEANPGYFQAYSNAGTALERLGKIDEAITYFEKAIEINPGYEQAQNNLKSANAQKISNEEGVYTGRGDLQ